MAVVYVGRHQDPSRVARSLIEAAERVGGEKPTTITDGPTMGFVVDAATHSAWRTAAKSGPDAKKRKPRAKPDTASARSEEHTSELQSRGHLVCRLLLEKKKNYSHATQT